MSVGERLKQQQESLASSKRWCCVDPEKDKGALALTLCRAFSLAAKAFCRNNKNERAQLGFRFLCFACATSDKGFLVHRPVWEVGGGETEVATG